MGLDQYFHRTVEAIDFDEIDIAELTEVFACLEGQGVDLPDRQLVSGYQQATIMYKVGQLRKAHDVHSTIMAEPTFHQCSDEVVITVAQMPQLQLYAHAAIGERINMTTDEAMAYAAMDWDGYQWWLLHRISSWVIDHCKPSDIITYTASW